MTDNKPREEGLTTDEQLLDQLLMVNRDALLRTVSTALDTDAGLAQLAHLRALEQTFAPVDAPNQTMTMHGARAYGAPLGSLPDVLSAIRDLCGYLSRILSVETSKKPIARLNGLAHALVRRKVSRDTALDVLDSVFEEIAHLVGGRGVPPRHLTMYCNRLRDSLLRLFDSADDNVFLQG